MGVTNNDIIKALDKIRLNNLYVHNDELEGLVFAKSDLRDRKVYLVETLAVVNALVERGTMLLFGGHGGGKTTLAKYLGQVFCGFSKIQIEECILRGHPQLTEEKILGSLDIAQLTKAKDLNNGKVDVIWNSFVDAPWKIIDELNRLSPYAQNILLSLLAESSVKYHNDSKLLNNFTLFATMNPKDEANFAMSLPFLDRFALALPITMPDYESLSTIGKKDKSSKQDDLSEYLKDFDLKEVQEQVRNLPYNEDAELFINVIISNYRLCVRITKEANDSLNVDNGLCTQHEQCHFKADLKVCSKVLHPLSVRVKEDLYRYGQALAWYLGDGQVTVDHIQVLAPYLIWHRSEVSEEFKEKLKGTQFKEKKYTVNIKLESTKALIRMIRAEFEGIKPFLHRFDQVKKGKLEVEQFQSFVKQLQQVTSEETQSNNSLILIKEIAPQVLNKYAPVYLEIKQFNAALESAKSLKELQEMKESIVNRYDIPNRQYLADAIEKKKRAIGALNAKQFRYTIPFENFIQQSQIHCPEIYHRYYQKYRNDAKPALNKEEVLFDFDDNDFELVMKRVLSPRGSSTSDLIFRMKTHEENIIKESLDKMNAS